MASLTEVYAALTSIAQQLASLVNSNNTVFPHTTASSSTVSAGTLTFNSSQPNGFMIVQTSSGATVKIPFYPP